VHGNVDFSLLNKQKMLLVILNLLTKRLNLCKTFLQDKYSLIRLSFSFVEGLFCQILVTKAVSYLELPAKKEFCLLTEFVNVRNHSCSDCTVFIGYSSTVSLHMDSYDVHSHNAGCYFRGGIPDEDNFGFYAIHNSAFRCTSSPVLQLSTGSGGISCV